ncbi:MAG: hypothetical protein G01um101444_70 [Parcubacteria group bacterium Gr01-1014_44]|nr:MAG: hypothetical protein G01um101444_70 [Parcubacteria group bacterium Gr01-1014_44]
MLKQIILLAVTTVAALVFWLVTKPLIEGPMSAGWRIQAVETWLWPLVLLCLLAGLLALSFLLLDQWATWLVMGLNLIIFALLFNPTNIITWGGVAIALFFQLYARKIIQGEKNNHLRINLKLTVDPGLRRLITSVLILISFGYFLSSGVQAAAQKKELPGAVRKTVQVVVGSYVSENLEIANPSLRAQATETVLSQITNFLNPYFVFLPPIFAFSLFLILQGLSTIFIWLAVAMTLFLFWFLKVLKVIKIEKASKEADVINF